MPSYRAHTRVTYGARTDTVVNVPTGTQNGDYLLTWLTLENVSHTPPSGWTLLRSVEYTQGATTVYGSLYGRVASSEPSSYTWTHSSANSEATMVAVRNVSSTVKRTANTGTGQTITATGITTTTGAWVGFFSSSWASPGGTTSPPSGTTPTFTERVDEAGSRHYVADGVLTTFGSTGNKSITVSGQGASDGWMAVLVAIEATAWPVLEFEGAIAANTTGNLTVTLPSHLANDILIVAHAAWVPETTGDAAAITAPSGWTEITQLVTPASGEIDGRIAWFWRRAASGSETNPAFTRPSGWATGANTCWGGRAYTIRRCVSSGTPWDQAAASSVYNTANQNIPAVTVSGSSRTVIQFCNSQDNQTFGSAPTNWTAGTAAQTSTGSDAGFQTFRRENVSSSTSAQSTNVAAPQQGFYAFLGISFVPPPPAATLQANTSAPASLTGDLTTTIRLVASSAAPASLTGDLTAGEGPLRADAAAPATLSGALTTAITIGATATAPATLAGALTTSIRLRAADEALATLSGFLTADGAPPTAPRTTGVEMTFNIFRAVTPSDTVDLAELTDSLYVGTGGNVVVVSEEGVATTMSVPSGTVLPLRVRRVNATGTTASGIVALYWS